MSFSGSPSSRRAAAANVNIPKYWVHKGSGQGYVNAHGGRVYLGKDGLPETTQRYHQFVAEYLANAGQPAVEPGAITLKELVARFWIHAEQYYVDAKGNPSTELGAFWYALKPLIDLFAEMPVSEFGPRALKSVRQRMIEYDWCRGYINKQVVRIKGVFRWGAENELIPGPVYHALQAVTGLKKGRCGARENPPVKPVPRERIDAIEPFVSRQVWAIVQLQLLTGARAGELVGLRRGDIDTTGEIWTCQLDEHKTAYHDHQRVLYFGPEAKKVLQPFLLRPDEAYLFSPREAEKDRREKLAAERATRQSCGNRSGQNKQPRPRREPGAVYDVAAYRRAIARACDLAFPLPDELARQQVPARGRKKNALRWETDAEWKKRLWPELWEKAKAWRKEHRWHPHQLRHNAATELRRQFGIETARIILGHRSAAITEVYAELDQGKALEAMKRVG